MAEAAKSDNLLNFGPGAPPRRKPISSCWCLFLTSVILSTLGVTLFLLTLATKFVINFTTPHQALFQNASLEEVANHALVVQPLVGREQTFDIAVTVWLGTGKPKPYSGTRRWKSPAVEADEALNATPLHALYSDIVFRGLRLTDKNVFSTVNFTVPTAML